MPWVKPNWDNEFKEFEMMQRRGHVDNAVKAFNVARRLGEPVRLSLEDPLWASMHNTTSGRPMTRSAAIVEAAANGHRIEPIFEAFDSDGDVQVPIIMLREDGTYYKVAGNHRLMAARALGIHPLVWMFEYPPLRESEDDEMGENTKKALREAIKETVKSVLHENSELVVPTYDAAIILPVERPDYDKSAFAGQQDVTELSSNRYHVTLISIRTLKPVKKELKAFWPEIVKNLPRAPVPQFDSRPRVARRDEGNKETWFLQVTNQDELRSYVQMIENAIRTKIPSYEGNEDRFFHLSVANNRNGNPFESIGDINKSDVDESDRA